MLNATEMHWQPGFHLGSHWGCLPAALPTPSWISGAREKGEGREEGMKGEAREGRGKYCMGGHKEGTWKGR